MRGPLIAIWMATAELVEALAVGGGHVFHVCHVLQPSFNLERNGTGGHQFLKMVNLAHVLERQQVTALLDDMAVGVLKIEFQPAELCTLPPVGTPTETIL